MYHIAHNNHRERTGKGIPTSAQDTEEYFDQRIKRFSEDMMRISIMENTENSNVESSGRKDET